MKPCWCFSAEGNVRYRHKQEAGRQNKQHADDLLTVPQTVSHTVLSCSRQNTDRRLNMNLMSHLSSDHVSSDVLPVSLFIPILLYSLFSPSSPVWSLSPSEKLVPLKKQFCWFVLFETMYVGFTPLIDKWLVELLQRRTPSLLFEKPKFK